MRAIVLEQFGGRDSRVIQESADPNGSQSVWSGDWNTPRRDAHASGRRLRLRT
jgi:hypothetical protein